MLILAGVSINAIVGENGVLTNAQRATIENKKASILEAIDLELASYNIDTILNSPEETSSMLSGLMNKGLIDTVLSSSGQTEDTTGALAIPQFDDSNNYTGYTDYGVMKDDYSILLSVDMNGIYKAGFGEVKVSSGGSVAAGTTVVTGNAFNSGSGTENPEDKGKFIIDNDASVMFVDEINGELSIQVKSGTHAKVNIFKDMTLTNNGIQRSAIDIEVGGTLDLYVAEGATVTVNSGGGINASGAIPGIGGYAGIHVPNYETAITLYTYETEMKDGKMTYKLDNSNNPVVSSSKSSGTGTATLNIKGGGKVITVGGDGSAGATIQPGSSILGAGGGGAGAGIGGNGGAGAKGKKGAGENGGAGENCGNVNISGTIEIYAYGGTGGSGGSGSLTTGGVDGQGGGAGGYPAAGIGGGRSRW